MKTMTCAILALVLALSLWGCGGAEPPAVPEDPVFLQDVHTYITEILDENAVVEACEKIQCIQEEDSLAVRCTASYSTPELQASGTFALTYGVENGQWVLKKCRVQLDDVTVTETEPEETEPELVYEAPIVILKQPVSGIAPDGSTYVLNVEAVGQELVYEWWVRYPGQNKFTKSEEWTGAEYTDNMNSTYDGVQVYCVIADSLGNCLSSETVTMRKGDPENPIVINKQPMDAVVYYNRVARVSVDASGYGLEYEWWAKDNGDTRFYKSPTYFGKEYTSHVDELRNGRQVYCRITDAYGNVVVTDTVRLWIKDSEAMKAAQQNNG